MKILDFFLFLWVIFALLDPDPDPATQINVDPCGSGSETLFTNLAKVNTFPFFFLNLFVNFRGKTKTNLYVVLLRQSPRSNFGV
jgi:hypothetical protein